MAERRTTVGSLYGTNRADKLTGAAQQSSTPIHIYARKGDDTLVLEFAPDITGYAAGHHARGDGDTNRPRGADQYHFENTGNVRAGGVAVGRLEDLDSADRIYVDGAPLDLLNLPSHVRTVAYGGVHNDPGATAQQWLLIGTQTGGHIFYALEGARIDMTGNGGTSSGRMESHFIPADMLPVFSRLRDIVYVDPENTLPPDGGIAIKGHDRTIADVRRPITGGPEGDAVSTGLNGDTVEARAGDDTVWAGSGNDRVLGGAGRDHLRGGFGEDLLAGNTGPETISGGQGHDTVFGGDGVDVLTGGRGADALWGDSGDDWLNGGYGGIC